MSATVQTLTAECAGNLMSSGDPKVVKAMQERPDVHESVMRSVIKNFGELPPLKMGGQKNDWKIQQKKRIAAVEANVKVEMSNTWKVYLGIGAGVLVFLVGGLGLLLLVLITACLSWCIECYLDEHYKIQEARLAAGYA